jgi:hypothetical protein
VKSKKNEDAKFLAKAKEAEETATNLKDIDTRESWLHVATAYRELAAAFAKQF